MYPAWHLQIPWLQTDSSVHWISAEHSCPGPATLGCSVLGVSAGTQTLDFKIGFSGGQTQV